MQRHSSGEDVVDCAGKAFENHADEMNSGEKEDER